MNNNDNESKRNENHIYHCILSWCGEHKMKLLLIGILISSIFLGGYWSMNEECPNIKIDLMWAEAQNLPQIQGEHGEIPQIEENVPEELLVTLYALGSGKFHAIIEKQQGSNVKIAETKNGPWKDQITLISTAVLNMDLQETTFSVWIKAERHPQGFDSGIYVEASLTESCVRSEHLYFSVISPKPTDTPTPTPSPTPSSSCLGSFFIVIVIFLGILYGYPQK